MSKNKILPLLYLLSFSLLKVSCAHRERTLCVCVLCGENGGHLDILLPFSLPPALSFALCHPPTFNITSLILLVQASNLLRGYLKG
jgi:hypothetical protein